MIVNGQERADGLAVAKWRVRFSGLHDLEIEDAEKMGLDKVVLFLVATRAGKFEVQAMDDGDVRRTNVAAVTDFLILTGNVRERAISALANGTEHGVLEPPAYDGDDQLQAAQREIDRLAAFLIQYGHGPLDESAVEMAMRLLDDPRVVGVLNGTLGTVDGDGEITRPTPVDAGEDEHEELPAHELETDPGWEPADDTDDGGWDPRDLPERAEPAAQVEPEPEPQPEVDPAVTPPQNPPEPGTDDEEPGGPPRGEVVGHMNDRSGIRDRPTSGGRDGPSIAKFNPDEFDAAPEGPATGKPSGGKERVGVAYQHKDPVLQRFMNEDAPR